MVLQITMLVGIIIESGPHLLFVTMYVSGNLPVKILLASSIVQYGQSMVPLIAESQRSFLVVKLINMADDFAFGSFGFPIFKERGLLWLLVKFLARYFREDSEEV